jgi:flavin-dependent dehydrogenase
MKWPLSIEDMLYDVIIIGGGVSGLSAAYALSQKKQRVLVVDRGKHIFERQRSDKFDVANGIGGAGLFSDGKLSMYPSATNLWKLSKEDLITGSSGTVLFDHKANGYLLWNHAKSKEK